MGLVPLLKGLKGDPCPFYHVRIQGESATHLEEGPISAHWHPDLGPRVFRTGRNKFLLFISQSVVFCYSSSKRLTALYHLQSPSKQNHCRNGFQDSLPVAAPTQSLGPRECPLRGQGQLSGGRTQSTGPSSPQVGQGLSGQRVFGSQGSMVSRQAISLTWGIPTSWRAAWT